jgi:hypothetical protein
VLPPKMDGLKPQVASAAYDLTTIAARGREMHRALFAVGCWFVCFRRLRRSI